MEIGLLRFEGTWLSEEYQRVSWSSIILGDRSEFLIPRRFI